MKFQNTGIKNHAKQKRTEPVPEKTGNQNGVDWALEAASVGQRGPGVPQKTLPARNPARPDPRSSSRGKNANGCSRAGNESTTLQRGGPGSDRGLTGLKSRAAGLRSFWGIRGEPASLSSGLRSVAREPCLHLQRRWHGLFDSPTPLLPSYKDLRSHRARLGDPGNPPHPEILNDSCQASFGS